MKYNRNDIFNGHVEVAPLNRERSWHACTIFNSAVHDGRSVAIVAGGTLSRKDTEIWDYSVEGSKWQTSTSVLNIVFETWTFSQHLTTRVGLRMMQSHHINNL